ncbi:YlbD family protein [Salipaludibacillus sp. HK11]|uniref:YlbD family protein n=1 Tax=Salipaludibacillus sp. HK11 TaxID=3394320 RepID=UPI0039FC9C8C
MGESLHPDVRKFKKFVKENPHILRDVNSKEKTLQDLFEEWMLFGEDDDIWDSYLTEDDEEMEIDDEDDKNDSETGSKTEVELLNMLKKMNLNDVQHHLAQFSTVVGSIQELFGQFKQEQTPETPPSQEQTQSSPFSFRED